MTVQELITQARRLIDDLIDPYLVSDETFVQLFDQMQNVFAERTFCLTAMNDEVAVSAAQDVVYYPRSVIQVRRIRTSDRRLIEPVTLNAISSGYVMHDYGLQTVSDWSDMTGRPRFAVTDLVPYAVRLVPIPEEPLTIYIDSYAYPEPLGSVDDEPEIPDVWHYHLIKGVLAELFGSHDYELYDAGEANRYMSLWERALMESTTHTELQRRGPGLISFSRTGVW